VDGRVLCVHGGLSPDLRTLDQVIALGYRQRSARAVVAMYRSVGPGNGRIAC